MVNPDVDGYTNLHHRKLLKKTQKITYSVPPPWGVLVGQAFPHKAPIPQIEM